MNGWHRIADLPDHLGGDVEHRALARRIGLGQRPGRLAGEIAVGVGHHRPDRVEHLVQLLRLHVLARRADHAVGRRQDRLVGVAEGAGRRQHAAQLLADHGQRALRQVAEVVGEVGVDAVDDRLVAVVAVLAERHLAQEEIAHRIDAVGVGQRERIDHVADRLRHLLAAVEQEAVREDAARHLDPGRHQERRPVDRVEAHDVLADDVQVGRPVALELVAVGVGKAGRGDVVGQRVDPDIHDVLVIAGHPHAPVEGGARDRQVLQAAATKLATSFRRSFGSTKFGPLVELEQLVLIGGQAEEVALLLHPLDRRAGLGGDPHLLLVEVGLVLGVVGLVAHRVPAGVFVEIDVAVLLHPLPDRLRRAVVALLRGADEVVVRALQALHHGLEPRHVALHQLARGDALARRGLLHLLTVLVGAGEEIHVVAVEPHEAGDGVGGDHLIGVPDVRGAVGVGDRGRDVIAGLGHFRLRCRRHARL